MRWGGAGYQACPCIVKESQQSTGARGQETGEEERGREGNAAMVPGEQPFFPPRVSGGVTRWTPLSPAPQRSAGATSAARRHAYRGQAVLPEPGGLSQLASGEGSRRKALRRSFHLHLCAFRASLFRLGGRRNATL